MTEKWLYVSKTPTSFLVLLWILKLNVGFWLMWSSGIVITVHCLPKLSKEEYEKVRDG